MASDEESIDTKSPDEKKLLHFRVLMSTIKTFGKRYGFDDEQKELMLALIVDKPNVATKSNDEFIRSLDYLGTVDFIERLCKIKNIYIPKIFYEQDEFFETIECYMNRDDPLSKKDRKIRKQKLSKWCNMNYDDLVRGQFFCCWQDDIDESLTENVRIILEETDIDEEYKTYCGPPRKVLGESDSDEENDT
jgi:hypothetical protein